MTAAARTLQLRTRSEPGAGPVGVAAAQDLQQLDELFAVGMQKPESRVRPISIAAWSITICSRRI